MLAYPGLVPTTGATVNIATEDDPYGRSGAYTPARSDGRTPAHQEDEADGNVDLRDIYQDRGFSKSVAETMLQARRSSSRKQYEVYLNKWRLFCNKKHCNQFNTTVNLALEFMQLLFDVKPRLSYSTMNMARSALSSYINIIGSTTPFGSQRDVKLFMKGVFNINPPVAKYAEMWDPDSVLTFLRTGPIVNVKETNSQIGHVDLAYYRAEVPHPDPPIITGHGR